LAITVLPCSDAGAGRGDAPAVPDRGRYRRVGGALGTAARTNSVWHDRPR